MRGKTQRQIKEGVLRPDKNPSGPAPVATTTIVNPSTGRPVDVSANGNQSGQGQSRK
jgi:hypothetical protein